MNLARTASLFMTELDRRRHTVVDLSASASQILTTLEGAGEPLPPYVIAKRLLVTTATMTTLLDTLERRGFVRRTPHPGDQRKLLIDITDAGREVVDALLPRIHAGNQEIFVVLAEEEREVFIRVLARLRGRLEKLLEDPVQGGPGMRVKSAVLTSGARTQDPRTCL